MKTELKTIERIMLLGVLNNQQGDLRTQRKIFRLLDRVEFSAAETQQIGLTELPNGMVQWTDADTTWPVEFPDGNDLVLLRQWYRAFPWKGYPARTVVALADKLGIRDDGSDG